MLNLQNRLKKLEEAISLPQGRTDDEWRDLIAFGPNSVNEKVMKKFHALPDARQKEILSRPGHLYWTMREMEWTVIGERYRLIRLFDGLDSITQEMADELVVRFKSLWYCQDAEVKSLFQSILAMIDNGQFIECAQEVNRVYTQYNTRLFYPLHPLMGLPERRGSGADLEIEKKQLNHKASQVAKK